MKEALKDIRIDYCTSILSSVDKYKGLYNTYESSYNEIGGSMIKLFEVAYGKDFIENKDHLKTYNLLYNTELLINFYGSLNFNIIKVDYKYMEGRMFSGEMQHLFDTYMRSISPLSNLLRHTYVDYNMFWYEEGVVYMLPINKAEKMIKAIRSNEIDINEFFKSKYFTSIKVGKFIRGMFEQMPERRRTTSLSNIMQNIDIEVEKLANRIISNKLTYTMYITDDMEFCYNTNNYNNVSHSLKESCLNNQISRYKSFYKSNGTKVVQCLDEDGKLLSRALLWDAFLEDGTPVKFMDTIYHCNPKIIDKMYDFAKESGFYTKATQSVREPLKVIDPNGNKCDITLYIKNNHISNPNTYPYLDTFKFTDDFKSLYNNFQKVSKTNSYSDRYDSNLIFCLGCYGSHVHLVKIPDNAQDWRIIMENNLRKYADNEYVDNSGKGYFKNLIENNNT